MTEPVVEAHAEEVGAEMVPRATASTTLWRTDDPATVLTKARDTADALAPVLREKGMLVSVSGKDYVLYEGWVTLGSMLGVTPVGVWTKRIDNGWEAKVDARTLDGRTIGSAEAMCLRTEENWAESDEFAIRSMAQTRAASKALASVLRFVVTLAGFSGTPAEEMTENGTGGGKATPASDKQRGWVLGSNDRPGLLPRAELAGGERHAVYAWAFVDGQLTKSAASKIIEALKDDPKAGKAQLLELAGYVESDVPADDEDLPEAETYQGDEDSIPF